MLIRLSFFWRTHAAQKSVTAAANLLPATHDNAVSTSFGPAAPNYRSPPQRGYRTVRVRHPAQSLRFCAPSRISGAYNSALMRLRSMLKSACCLFTKPRDLKTRGSDILCHYFDSCLPGRFGFQQQTVSSSVPSITCELSGRCNTLPSTVAVTARTYLCSHLAIACGMPVCRKDVSSCARALQVVWGRRLSGLMAPFETVLVTSNLPCRTAACPAAHQRSDW
jgi:hypothetical protein